MRPISLVLLAALASSRLAAAECKVVDFRPNILTPATTNLGPHGGVVIAELEFGGRRAIETKPATWRFRTGSHTAPATVTTIAPGLTVYTPPIRDASVVLEDGDHKVLVSVTAVGSKTAELAAPVVTHVKFSKSHERHRSENAWVELAGDPPDGAVALVVFDKAGKPRSFGSVATHAKQVTIYSASDCGGPVAGTIASQAGDEIRLAWLDAHGALSKRTAPIRVGN